jgi:hypothetical protein
VGDDHGEAREEDRDRDDESGGEEEEGRFHVLAIDMSNMDDKVKAAHRLCLDAIL